MIKNRMTLSIRYITTLAVCLTVCLSVLFPKQGYCSFILEKDSLAKHLEKYFGYRDNSMPGAIVIVGKDGKEQYRTFFGTANLELGTSITSETVFEAASVTKQFTAAAILQLIERQELSLDDDVRRYVPELPDYGTTITISHLLTHTSGLKDWRNVVYLTPRPTGEQLYTQESALEMICKQSNLNFLPGDQYRYNNSGYDLLATIVERLTDQSFARYVKENLLDPAGMTSSRIREKHTDVIANKANGYSKVADGYLQTLILDESYGAAGLLTTAEDLAKWNHFVNSEQVSEAFKEMRTTQFTLNNGQKIPYALGGVEVHYQNGSAVISHGGLIGGYRAWTGYIPEKKVSLAYMSNDRSISSVKMARVVSDVFLGEKVNDEKNDENSFDPSDSDIEHIAGVYQNIDDESYYLDLKVKDGELSYYNKTAQFIKENMFVIDEITYQYKDDFITHQTPEGIVTYRKVDSFSPSEEALQSYLGDYYSPDIDITLSLKIEKGKLVAHRSSYDSFVLTPIYQEDGHVVFRGFTNGLRCMFDFQTIKGGDLQLRVSLPRASNIPFIKQ